MDYFILDHVVSLGILLILSLGLNLINGFAGMFSLGHHGFFAVGAYAAAAFIHGTAPADPGLALGILIFVASFVVAVFFAALFGIIVAVPCLRLRGDYLAIATLGFGEIARIMAQNTEALGGATGMGIPYLLIEKSPETEMTYVGLYALLVIVLTVLTFIIIQNLIRSDYGRRLIALREDEVAAELSGVNLARAKLLAFVVGAAFAGIAGALFTNYWAYVEPKNFILMQGVYMLLFVVLGGMGSLSGTVIAGTVLYIVDKVILNLMPGDIQTWREVFFALVLILLMILRPQGMLGRKELNETKLWKRLFGNKTKLEAGA